MGQRDRHVVHEHAGAGAGERNGRLGVAHGESCSSSTTRPMPLNLDFTVRLLIVMSCRLSSASLTFVPEPEPC